MRITKLSLTNFRSFKETQTIEFGPVTLLFGPNSVGKSSVLMALFYLHQILEKGQCNPMRIEALGDKFVGGFKNLVHGKDLDKPITIAVEYEKADAIGESYYKLIDLFPDTLSFYLESPAISAQKIELIFELNWSNLINDAYISKYIVRLDGVGVALIESSADKKQSQIIAINYLHPLLKSDRHDEYLINSFEDQNIHPELLEDAFAEQNIELPSHHDIKNGADDILNDYVNDGLNITDDCYVGDFHELIADNGAKTKILGSNLWHDHIGIKSRLGATPVLGKVLESTIDLGDETQNIIVSEILSDILVAPLDNLLAILDDSICIGPLRHIPDANYQLNPYPSQSDWYDGKACWDSLSSQEVWRDSLVSEWLSNSDKLNLGYKIVYKTEDIERRFILPTMDIDNIEDVMAITDVDSTNLSMTVSEEDLSINPETQQTPIESSYINELRQSSDFNSKLYVGQSVDKRTTLSLWDCQNNIEVSASDIGVGVSQLLPLVVAAHTSRKGIIACEQPELHVHPKVQVGIGDLLTQVDSKSNFLIETHSEHLILRLLRRIRENSEEELPEGFKAVTADDVAVVFLESSDEGVRTKRLAITDDGDFEEDWPGGFFEERDEELF
jgi:predicted ATPase